MEKSASSSSASIRDTEGVQERPSLTSMKSVLPTEFLDLIKAARARPTQGFLRVHRAAEKSAIGVSTLWRDVKRGTFVPPVRISCRNVAWVEAEVDALLAAKALMSRTGKTIDLVEFVAALIKQPR